MGSVGKWLKWMGFLVALTAADAWAKDVLDLHVQEDLPVYSKPTEESTVISRLSRGDQVVVSPKLYGSFRKVLITYKGRAVGGYVPGRLIVRSAIRSRSETVFAGRKIYNTNYALGLALVGSFMRQGESSFQMSDTSVYDATAFQSFVLFFSLFLDMPLSERIGLRPYVSFRQTRFEGEVTERGSLAPTPVTINTVREQTLTGVGLVVKNYGRPGSPWWWGGGGEFAMGSRVKIEFNGQIATPEEDEKPFFGIVFGALGADVPLPLLKSLYLVPDLRLGSVLTTKPIILYAETFLGVAYQF